MKKQLCLKVGMLTASLGIADYSAWRDQVDRKYKSVENQIHAWIIEREKAIAGKIDEIGSFVFNADNAEKPYFPLTPLHSVELYLDSQFIRAS